MGGRGRVGGKEEDGREGGRVDGMGKWGTIKHASEMRW